jgi:hypothetical protein
MVAVSGAAGQALADSPSFVASGLTWSPAPSLGVSVGVGNVRRDASGDAITLFIKPNAGLGGWEYDADMRAGQTLPVSGGQIRIGAITDASPDASPTPGSPGHGGVELQAVATSAAPLDASVAYLPANCVLRLGDPDWLKHVSVKIESFLPDVNRPAAAVLAWTLEQLSFGLAKPEDYRRATVHAGSSLTIGRYTLHIRGVLARQGDMPAMIEVAFSPAAS